MRDSRKIVHDEQKKIFDKIEHFYKTAINNDADTLHREIASAINKLVPLIMSHFMLEENILYPAIVLNNDTIDTIDEMLIIQKEHGIIEQQLKQLMLIVKMSTLEDIKKSPVLSQLLFTTTLELYQTMKDHQLNEDKLFETFGI